VVRLSYINREFSSGYGLYIYPSQNSKCVSQKLDIGYGVYRLSFTWASAINNNNRMETGMFVVKFNGKLISIITPLDYKIHV
jgi:hypothetical protein